MLGRTCCTFTRAMPCAISAQGGQSRSSLAAARRDLPELLGRLTEFDYRGWVTIERRDSADPIAEIENAVAYLRAL